ncbi:TPA: hypothetical protein ACSVPQ_002513 [Clostridioides difficile]|uniref:hypothetical protein n=1 Tax=Clostridioides difficile TaxID=1496 RepID=UPI00130441D5|nr:hypothetical protein [Clostridioides difficile]MDI2978675.1 hypothetical protein [Clostridioides difficile]HBE8718253.1 hypothetical protein [Clostridioides difficile]
MDYSNKKQAKICTICERPYFGRTQSCPTCLKKLKELKDVMEPNGNYSKISINKVLFIKERYSPEDVFSFIEENKNLWRKLPSRNERLKVKRVVREYHRSTDYLESKYVKWEGEIPLYIKTLLDNYPSKKLLTLSGDKLNPNIHYVCLKCGEEQVQTYRDFKLNKSHNCKNSKSSGELLVEDYLKSFTKIKTQHNTLRCINPITGRQLPYDVEIVGSKLLIEIQGEQHLKYIEYFHGSIENFKYQQQKDSYKKEYAEKKGYKLLYIYYDDFKNDRFKHKIKSELDACK